MNNKKTVLKQIQQCYNAQNKLDSELSRLSALFSDKSGIDGLAFVAQYISGDGVLIHPIDNTVDRNLELSDLTLIRPEFLIESLPVSSVNELTGSI